MNSYKRKIGKLILGPLSLLVVFIFQSVSAAGESGGISRVLELQGISFHVICPNSGSINQLEIIPAGLEIDNYAIEREIDGTVTGIQVADMNGDASPEIYIYVNSAGSGAYGELIAYAANNKKSLSEIYLPPLADDVENFNGYMGHDEFIVIGGYLIRRFPIYADCDTNNNPTGGTRQLQYKLIPGEASWILELDKSITYQ